MFNNLIILRIKNIDIKWKLKLIFKIEIKNTITKIFNYEYELRIKNKILEDLKNKISILKQYKLNLEDEISILRQNKTVS